MEKTEKILPKKKLADFCRRRKVTELALFGSVVGEDFKPESDIDVLVTCGEEARWSLFDLETMQNELELIFGRSVDLVERTALKRSPNHIRKKNILRSLEVIHVA